MEDIMSKKTNAQLAAEVETLRQQLEAAQNASQRQRFYGNLWPNQNRRTERDPAWQGTIRIVVHGKAIWLDMSQWDADPERFASNPPDFSVSLSPTPEERACELEQARDKALREKGGV
jgi:hypothetical protein